MDNCLQSISATQSLTFKIWSDAYHLHSAYMSDAMLQGQNPIHLAVMRCNDCPNMLFEDCPLDPLICDSSRAAIAMRMKDNKVFALGCVMLVVMFACIHCMVVYLLLCISCFEGAYSSKRIVFRQ